MPRPPTAAGGLTSTERLSAVPPYDENDMRRAEEIARKLARDEQAKRDEEAARKAEQDKRKN